MTAQLLLLAGTVEARLMAERLGEMPEVCVTASLAGVTTDPAPIAAQTRRGGFGGAAGLAAYLREHAISAVIDATHPFAAQMATNAALACAATATPRLRLIRPPWEPVGDWRDMRNLTDTAAALPSGAHALLTSGTKKTAPFAARTDIRCLLRVIEPVTGLPAHITQLVTRPPFSLEAETALLRDHAITHLVSKNAGGSGRAKLDAAAQLHIPVFMVQRPAPTPGPLIASVAEAVAWVAKTVVTGT